MDVVAMIYLSYPSNMFIILSYKYNESESLNQNGSYPQYCSHQQG